MRRPSLWSKRMRARLVLELGEVVALALQEVGDLVERRVRQARLLEGAAAGAVLLLLGQPRGHLLELGARVLVEVEERDQHRGALGLAGKIEDVLVGDAERSQKRLVEQLGERVGRAPLAERRHERLHLDPEERERLPQERQLHRALALLEEVQIRAGDAERARHVGLLQPALEPQLAHSSADVGVVAQAGHA